MSEECFEVEVIYPYQAAEKNQISLKRKEKISVLQADASGWWIGKNSRGQVGIFPSTYTSLGVKVANADNPLEGIDKDNKVVLWKVLDQLLSERKQLLNERDSLKEELVHAREKLDSTLEEITVVVSPKPSEKPIEAPPLVDRDIGSTTSPPPLTGEAATVAPAQVAELEDKISRLTIEKDTVVNELHLRIRTLETELKEQQTRHEAALAALSQRNERCKHDDMETIQKLKARLEMVENENANLQKMARSYEDLSNRYKQYETLPGVVTELKKLYQGEAAERRRLYSLIQDLKGKVRVFCRLRPLLPAMDDLHQPQCVNLSEDGFRIRIDDPNKLVHFYDFDNCFGQDSTQQEVFDAVQPVIASALDGYNICVFAYGQTGSGKTYTMEGTKANPGVSYMAIKFLFDQIALRAEAYSCDVGMTCVEVYNDQVYDLLGAKDEKKELRMANGSCQVVDVTVIPVSSPTDVNQPLHRALGNRSTNSTLVNERSSRSHCILTFYLTGTSKVSGTKIMGKLHLIDLAGSERLSKSKAEGDRLLEANCINKSLSNLGRVVCALHRKQAHVPFRDSKLTYLLQDSLSGDSKTVLIANISPSLDCLGETYSTVSFATSVQKLELGEARRHVIESAPTTSTPSAVMGNSSGSSVSTPLTPSVGGSKRSMGAMATGPKSLSRSVSHDPSYKHSRNSITKIPTPPLIYQPEAFSVITNTTKSLPTTSQIITTHSNCTSAHGNEEITAADDDLNSFSSQHSIASSTTSIQSGHLDRNGFPVEK